VRLILTGLLAVLPLCAAAADRPAPVSVERNVIYGMYSGTALLLDVYRPAKPNGFGVVFVAGSGFHSDPGYGTRPLKETQIELWGPPLTTAGYTVFAINHRAAPTFHFPAALEDVQRAIRYVRAHAGDYGIDPAHLGGLGGSSGGNLVGLAAVRATAGIADDPDAVNREPATLQAVVLRAAVTDLRNPTTAENANFIVSYMEAPPGTAAKGSYDAASPVTQVGANAPPALLIHGDADPLVPYQQSVAMEAALRSAGIPVRLVTVPGGVHGADFGAAGKVHPEWPNYYAETVAWFDKYLRAR